MKKIKLAVRPSTLLIFLVIALFVILYPMFSQDYSQMILNLALIYSIATFGILVMLGMGGEMTFSVVTFMGVGAYFTANMCSGRLGFQMDTGLALLGSILIGGVLSFLIGLILLKLRGTYFTFATMGLVQVAWSFFQNYRTAFGGPDGISNIKTLSIFGHQVNGYKQWFYVLCTIVLVVALLVERLRRSQLGRSLAAIRDNETAAYTLGVNVYITKVIAFTIAGMLAALSGSLYAMHSQFVSSDMFTFERATSYTIIAMLGGVNNTLGIFVGSLLVTMLPEWLRAIQHYLQLLYGISVIMLMVFMPMGLAGIASAFCRKINRKLKEKRTGQKITAEKAVGK